MTTRRIILAAFLGGLAMFIWNAIAHMALPLGEAGISEIQNEQPVLAAMQTAIGDQAGLFRFPAVGAGTNMTQDEAMKQYAEKLKTNPSGLLIYHPPGSRPMDMARWLSIEFALEVFEALIGVLLLCKTRINSFGGRVGFFVALGILAAVTTNVSYWNWHGFPGIYTASYMLMQAVGFLCAGLVVAPVLGRNTGN